MQKAIEIFKNALELEVQAELFYEKAVEMTTNDESRMVFLELADMEDSHAHRIVEGFKDTAFGQTFDADAWLQELEKETSKILPTEANELVSSGNMQAVLDFAIKMEEEARDSYRHLAEIFTDTEDKAYCTDLANEEQEHIDAVLQLRRSLDMDEDERPDL